MAQLQPNVSDQKPSASVETLKLLRLSLNYELNTWDEKVNDDDVAASLTVDVPSSFSLYQLHDFIQVAFNWQDYHLHQFETKINNQQIIFEIPGLDDYWETELTEDHSQWISHEHPHAVVSGSRFQCEWKCDERVITIYDALFSGHFRANLKNPTSSNKLKYEYDFGSTHTIFITCDEIRIVFNPKDLKFPKIVNCNDGIHHIEDYNDIAKININQSQQAVNKNYSRQWPLVLFHKNVNAKFCYICRKHNGCPNRTQCSGVCCAYCMKKEIIKENLNLAKWSEVYLKQKKILHKLRQEKIDGKPCQYVPPDGDDCCVCVRE